MRALLIVIGTRGDVEPFLSIGEKLLNKGHEVVYCVPEQLGYLVPDTETWVPLDRGFLEMLDGSDGRALMSGYLSPIQKARAVLKLASQGIQVNRKVVKEQIQALEDLDPELVICHPKCSVPLLWAIQRGRRFAFLSPIPFYIHSDRRQPHTGINGNFGAFLNRLTYPLLNAALSLATWGSAKRLPEIRSISVRRIYQEVMRAKFFYAVSPSFYSRQPGWRANVQILGHSTRSEARGGSDAHLMEFLDKHDRVLLVTFGSMVSSMPEKASQFIYECLRDIGCPIVINIAGGGLVRLPEFESDPNFCFVDTISYHDVLPHARAVIHHGGSGTTHLGLRYGCPTLIIPHVFDQFTWGGLIESIGAGPAPVAVNRIRPAEFTSKVRDLLENPSYKRNAMQMSATMKAESSDLDLEKLLVEPSR